MAAEPIIQACGLTRRYGRKTAVDGLNLAVYPGEIFGLLGPNGAGKTTTILMLMGLSEPSAGTCSVLGLSPRDKPLEIKRRVGYLPENVGFYPDMTARQNLRYVAELNRLESAEALVAENLELVGLAEAADLKVSAFSRGMRQRLGLAEVLIKSPEIFFLDEPTLGLDPDGIDRMLDLIADLSAARKLTVVLSSHLLHLVERVAHRVAILKKGRLMASGRIADLAAEAGLEPNLPAVYRHYFNAPEGPCSVRAGVTSEHLSRVQAESLSRLVADADSESP